MRRSEFFKFCSPQQSIRKSRLFCFALKEERKQDENRTGCERSGRLLRKVSEALFEPRSCTQVPRAGEKGLICKRNLFEEEKSLEFYKSQNCIVFSTCKWSGGLIDSLRNSPVDCFGTRVRAVGAAAPKRAILVRVTTTVDSKESAVLFYTEKKQKKKRKCVIDTL